MSRKETIGFPRKNTSICYLMPMISPENMYTDNIIQKEHVILMHLEMYTNVYVTVNERKEPWL